MKTILSALITLIVGVSFAATKQELEVIHTLHGKSYQQCKIMQRDADGVAFSHLKGIARVLFSDLPESTRFELGYNPGAAADLQSAREAARKEKADKARQQQERAAELLHAARLAEIKRLTQTPRVIVVPAPSAPYYTGPVPAVGFAASGWFGGGHRARFVPPTYQFRGWENVGIATIGSGSGGIYLPQSGGFYFTGVPQVHYSPTLGYYNPGGFAAPAVPSRGNFDFVPGLAAPNPPAVVPGAAIPGRASLPMGR